MFDNEMGAILDGYNVSTTTLGYLLLFAPKEGPMILDIFKGLSNETSCSNAIWTHPYAYPRHIKVEKHFICD
jgi:hypothetical protein